MPVKYDADVLRQSAQRLTNAATMLRWELMLVGFVLVFGIAYEMDPYSGQYPQMAGGLGVMGGAAGWILGYWRGFRLRLDAQSALALAAIEENTRPSNVGRGTEIPGMERAIN